MWPIEGLLPLAIVVLAMVAIVFTLLRDYVRRPRPRSRPTTTTITTP